MVAQHVLEIMNIYRVLSSTSNYLGDEIYVSLSLDADVELRSWLGQIYMIMSQDVS